MFPEITLDTQLDDIEVLDSFPGGENVPLRVVEIRKIDHKPLFVVESEVLSTYNGREYEPVVSFLRFDDKRKPLGDARVFILQAKKFQNANGRNFSLRNMNGAELIANVETNEGRDGKPYTNVEVVSFVNVPAKRASVEVTEPFATAAEQQANGLPDLEDDIDELFS